MKRIVEMPNAMVFAQHVEAIVLLMRILEMSGVITGEYDDRCDYGYYVYTRYRGE